MCKWKWRGTNHRGPRKKCHVLTGVLYQDMTSAEEQAKGVKPLGNPVKQLQAAYMGSLCAK